jgi:hypothetical protein
VSQKVNILVVVDVVGALSEGTLHDGNLSMVDDSPYGSTGQGTPDLSTVCHRGQLVEWSVVAVDVQTPVEIRGIRFITPGGDGDRPQPNDHAQNTSTLALNTWTGVVPPFVVPGMSYPYRLELQMYEGEGGTLSIDSPALSCL